MKRRNAVWIFLILFFLLIAGLYFSRNQWVGYLLKKQVSGQTNGNVTLSFQAIHIDIFKKRLTISDPSLTYKNTFLDREHALKLESTRFKELSIYDLYLWNFLMRRQYICRELTVVQPTFQLASEDSAHNLKPHFNPSIWLRIIENHRLVRSPLKFQIQHAYVKLGKVRLGKRKVSGESGGADYSISIRDLGNLENPVPSDEVFYKNLEVEIHNFYRNSKRRNFTLKVDTISYTSLHEAFVVRGVHYHPESENKVNDVKLNIRQASIHGLYPDSARKTFRLAALHWEGGSVVFPEGKLKHLFSRKQANKNLEEIIRTFPYLQFDTLVVNRIRIFRVGSDSDTVMSVRNFNIRILGARLTGKTFSDPLQNMTFTTLKTNLAGFHFLNKSKGLQVNASEIQYGSDKKLISADSLTWEQSCGTGQQPIWKLTTQEMHVQDFSAEQFRKGEKQSISVEFQRPQLQIWKSGTCTLPGSNNIPELFDKLSFRLLKLGNGSVHYFGKKKETFSLSGLNFYAGNLKRKSDSGNFSFSYDTLYFRADHSGLVNPQKALTMYSGPVRWLGRDLSLKQVLLHQKQKGNLRNISIPTAVFEGLNLNALFFEKKLTGRQADFLDPTVTLQQQDPLHDADTIPFSRRQLSVLPVKIAFSKVNVIRGHLNLTMIHTKDSLNLKTGVNLAMNQFRVGFDKHQLMSAPEAWNVLLNNTSFRNHRVSGNMESVAMNSGARSLDIKGLDLLGRSQTQDPDFRIEVPDTKLTSLDYAKLFRSDSLVFGKISLNDAAVYFEVPSTRTKHELPTSELKETTVLFDSLELNHSGFILERKVRTSSLKITGKQLNVLYRPMFRSQPQDHTSRKDLLKKWDISLQHLRLADTLNNIRIVADGIALQSKYNQLSIDSISGSNLPRQEALETAGKDYADFRLLHMKFSGLQLTGKDFRGLNVSRWTTPEVWMNMIHGGPSENKADNPGLIFSFLNKNTGFLNRVHIDSTQFNKLNFKFLYDNRKKLINIYDVGLAIRDIEVDTTLGSSHPNYLFKDLRLDSHGKAFLSGDSMYTFRTRDVRVNLPLKRISFDSITVTPRYKKEVFFKKAKTQTDRVTAYGKSIDFNNFDFSTLLNQKVFHVGSIRLNNFNVLFERDKHYPLSDSVRPMPLEMLRRIPYKFKADTVLINHGFVSYYEYQIKASNPGIFFINNFDVSFLNVTDDFSTLDSAAVLKVHGSGQMMRTTGLNFVLVMPYFSPDDRFWFSAQTGNTDLSQFNSLARNVIGISIISGTGNADVQYVSGNDKFAKGNILFQYKNLKLRLYNRKKARTSKGMGSPFVNFMLNNLMIRTNNPKFLKPPRKGIVYFERDPRKSFINYLWKSSFSGITSTLGFNSRQQRQEKKTERQEAKAEE